MVAGASCVGAAAGVGAVVGLGLAEAGAGMEAPANPGVSLRTALDGDAVAGGATNVPPLGVA
jgi:hypothetical protein